MCRSRTSEVAKIQKEEINNTNPYDVTNKSCMNVYRNPTKIKAIVIGDSHADAMTTSVATTFN